MGEVMRGLYKQDSYYVKKKPFKFFGRVFYIYSQDNMNQSLGYAEQSIFKATQDIHI